MKVEADPQFLAARDALDRGDVATLRSLLQQHPQLVHARYPGDDEPYSGYFHGAQLLHHVAGNPIRGDLPENIVEITRLLLEMGADPNGTCGGGPTQPHTSGGTTLGLVASGYPAHVAGVSADLIDVLLNAGAEMDAGDNGGCMWIALYHTVEHQGQRDVARMLYDRGHRVDFCFAAGLGLWHEMEKFYDEQGRLRADADFLWRHHRRSKEPADEGQILAEALLFSSINNWPQVATSLLERGAAIDAQSAWGPEKVTPVQGAIWANWPPMLRLLLDRGADATIRDPNHNSSAIGWALFFQRQDLVDILLEDETRVDLMDSIELGRHDLFEQRMEGVPADASLWGDPGALLRTTAAHGHLDMVKLLLQRGADPNLSNRNGESALFWARKNEHDPVVAWLKAHGAREDKESDT